MNSLYDRFLFQEYLLGMPETSFNGRRTRTARNVRKSNELLFLILIVAKLKIFQSYIDI